MDHLNRLEERSFYQKCDDFLNLVDNYIDLGYDWDVDGFIEGSYLCIKRDGVTFSIGANEKSVDFDIYTSKKVYFSKTYEHDEHDMPHGDKFEAFLSELKTQFENAIMDTHQN